MCQFTETVKPHVFGKNKDFNTKGRLSNPNPNPNPNPPPHRPLSMGK